MSHQPKEKTMRYVQVVCPFCQDQETFTVEEEGKDGGPAKMRCGGCSEPWYVSSELVYTAITPIMLSEKLGNATPSPDGTS